MRKVERFQTGETLRDDIGPKLNQIVERVNRDIRGDGRSIAVNEVGSSVVISQIGPRSGGGGGSPASIFVVQITALHPDFLTLHSDYATNLKKPWYIGSVYANGFGGTGADLISPTITDAIIRFPRLLVGEYGAGNMWAMAAKIKQTYFDHDDATPILDGGEKQSVDVYWVAPGLL